MPLSSELLPEPGKRGFLKGLRSVGFRSGRIAALITLMTLLIIPIQLLAIRYKWRLCSRIPIVYHRTALRLIGVKVRLHGVPADHKPVLFAANHVSWLDISVLGSIIEGCFIAKREVGEWAGFGTLARLQRTLFIDRDRRRRTSAQNEEIEARLVDGDNLILFAEGTSSAGDRVLPFKSALFGAAERAAGVDEKQAHKAGNAGHENAGSGLTVQPVTIAYTAINGIPLTRSTRPRIGWYGDMSMMPHFTDLLALGRIAVDVHFHTPVNSRDYASRKTLAAHCEREVRRGLNESNRRSALPRSGRSAGPRKGRRLASMSRRFARRPASDIRDT